MKKLPLKSFIKQPLLETPFHGTIHDFERFSTEYSKLSTQQPLWGLNFTRKYGDMNIHFAKGRNGFVFEVIFTEPNTILNLSKPIKNQPKRILPALRAIINTLINSPEFTPAVYSGSLKLALESLKSETMLGFVFINTLKANCRVLNIEEKSKKAISLFLLSFGIKGILNRDLEFGAEVYTIWDDSILKIVNKTKPNTFV